MTFLNPLVLFGLLAASIPILIHLLNLRKLKKVEFSTIAFLKELQKNKIRKVKLKQWLLLALRVLIILFVVLAFARPTLEGLAIGGTTSAAKTTAVFIVDDTFSMSVIDNQGSYLNQAKAAVKNLLKNFQEGDEAALILVSQSEKGEVNIVKNLSDLQKSIDEIEPAYQTGLLHNAIAKAVQALAQSKNFNKEIYIFSDFQDGRLADENSLSDFSQVLDDRFRIYTVNYSGKTVRNLGIDDIKINTQIFEKDKPVNFSVTVTNYSAQSADNVVVSLFVNNERSAQVSTNLNAGESKIMNADAIIKSTGYNDVFAEIEDDEILQDNRRYTNIFVPENIPIIIFTDENADSRFVELALTAIENQKIFKITKRNLSELNAYNLKNYDVVFIIGSFSLSNPERLKNFVAEGGGLFISPGSKSNLSDFNKILSDIGLPKTVALVGRSGDPSNSFQFDKTDLNHPVFKDIFTNKEKTRIESAEIYSYFRVNTEGKGRNIISMQDGSSFLGDYKIGDGKIFLLNSVPNLNWGNFPIKSIFVPLINKSALYLASKDKIEQSILAGNDFNIDLRGRSLSQLKILRPDKTEDHIILNQTAGNNYVDYNKLNITGNYKFLADNIVIDEISINADPLESKVKYYEKTQFEEYLNKINFKGNLLFIDKNENISDAVLKARFGSELWKYFLIFALLLALIEMLVARNAKKDLVEIK